MPSFKSERNPARRGIYVDRTQILRATHSCVDRPEVRCNGYASAIGDYLRVRRLRTTVGINPAIAKLPMSNVEGSGTPIASASVSAIRTAPIVAPTLPAVALENFEKTNAPIPVGSDPPAPIGW